MVKSYPPRPILLVDDEVEALQSMRNILEISGISNVQLCSDSREVKSLISKTEFSAITLDLSMPHVSGQELLDLIVAEHREESVIVVTAANDIDTAVDCMRAGAFDYLLKPVDKTRLTTAIGRAVTMWEMRSENTRLTESLLSDGLAKPDSFGHIVTASDRMHNIFRYIEVIAPTTLPVLITGETGTGKELIAGAVHAASGRTGEFVAINVAGLDDTLFSDTLFGHLPGAYTGATGKRDGMIQRAESGTLFLDEIGDLSTESQVKLLRLLQEGEYLPLGADRPKTTNARFVVATNKDLPDAIENGEFRSDLYYRLRSHQVSIPALRQRKEDLPLLADHFLEQAYGEIGKELPQISAQFYQELENHDYPGNVRELEGMIFDLAVRNTSPVLSFGPAVEAIVESAHTGAGSFYESMGNLPTVDEAVERLIAEAMRRSDGNQTEAAKVLGMDRTTLNRRLNRGN
jgi:DNA-binding NtrC family response regulator